MTDVNPYEVIVNFYALQEAERNLHVEEMLFGAGSDEAKAAYAAAKASYEDLKDEA